MTTRLGTIALFFLLTVCTWAQQAGLIKDIEIRGNKEVSKEAILATMRTKIGQPYLQANLDSDKRALEDLGFFQSVDVRARAVEGDAWVVSVDVLEWPVIKEFRIVGNTVFPASKIRSLITLQEGKIFNLRQALVDAKKIEDLYRDKGYLAPVEDFKPLRESPGTVNVAIREFTINSISVQGNSRTKDSVFRKLIKSKAGQPFNRNTWEQDLRRIYGTQWFENVKSLQEQVQDDPFRVNLIADVKEARTGQLNVGAQLDPRSSFAAILKLADTNYRGTGQSIGVDFTQAASGGGPSIGLDYGNPFIDNHDTSLHISLYSRLIYRFTGSGFGTNEVPTEDNRYTERRTGGSIGLSRQISTYSAIGINTRLEKIDTNDLNTGGLNGFIKQDGTVGVSTLGFTRNTRDVDIDPSRGSWLRAQIEPGFANITSIGGTVSDPSILGMHPFAKFNIDYRHYFTDQKPRTIADLAAPRRVLALRVFYGAITGKVPFFEQYFAGGSNTIRGYPEDRFWGNNTLVSNLELRYPVQPSFSVIGFVDYGGAWGGYDGVNDFTQSRKLDLHLGYGFGFSFRTPLGPLRLDFGFDESGRTRTHFLIGTSF